MIAPSTATIEDARVASRAARTEGARSVAWQCDLVRQARQARGSIEARIAADGGRYSRSESLRLDALIAVEDTCRASFRARAGKGNRAGRSRVNRKPSPSKTRALPRLDPVEMPA